MNGKLNTSVTSMVPARRKSSTLRFEGRDDRGFPIIDHDDHILLELEAVLAKMRNMTPEEAAAHAAQVVAEAEVALADAAAAMREAEEAEAEAEAAVAALMKMRGRNTRQMPPNSRRSVGKPAREHV